MMQYATRSAMQPAQHPPGCFEEDNTRPGLCLDFQRKTTFRLSLVGTSQNAYHQLKQLYLTNNQQEHGSHG